ncbi:MAG: nucleoside triphosphate pyrophosphohydrolase [Candidatus Marinimicrobia bacterium]|nr:nucleoside triphosphate pyrophosphohydrolase [Candidatus Neomarinimicrobiota bacterium]|tara:strand:+ start:2770 stop:3549 length:780 start_codon:yes stop_codon:yes gene_type:complete
MNSNSDKFLKLIEILKQLRAPGGCDWDISQTHESLIPYLIEETYEVVEAIENKSSQDLREELGDLILHVIFQAELSSENGEFDIFDCLDSVNNKLISRHPHVFNEDYDGNGSKKGSWEKSKKKEKKRDSVLDGVPKSLPGLLRSRRIQEKASSVGFDWQDIGPVINKVEEELEEVKDAINQKNKDEISMELGDLMFAVVNLARFHDIDPEDAIKRSTNKFITRFHKIEKKAKDMGEQIEDLDLDSMDQMWDDIKLNENK